MNPEEAVRQLTEGLERARAIMDGKADPTHDPANANRSAVIEALCAFHDFSINVGIRSRLNAPLHHLIQAMGDAVVGLSNPILEPNRIADRKMASRHMDYQQLCTAAAAATILKDRAGWKLKDAIKEAAIAVGASPERVEFFRKKVSARRGNDDEQEAYAWFLRHFREQYGSGMSDAEIALTILDIARDMKTNIPDQKR